MRNYQKVKPQQIFTETTTQGVTYWPLWEPSIRDLYTGCTCVNKVFNGKQTWV